MANCVKVYRQVVEFWVSARASGRRATLDSPSRATAATASAADNVHDHVPNGDEDL